MAPRPTHSTRLQATGPVAYVVNLAVFAALYLTPDYAPALAVTSDAALVFYGALMLLAAVRGYAGCEVLAVSNWLLGRGDQIGCMPFWLRAPRPRATVHMATLVPITSP